MSAPDAADLQALEAANAALQQRVAMLEAEVTALQQRQHLLDAIFEATTDAVFVKDRQGRYLLVNPAFAALVQRPLEAIIGRDDATLFPAEMAHWLRVDDQQVMTTGATHTFEEVGTSTGSRRLYLSAKSPWQDAQGSVLGVIGIARDITDRKQAEAALRESEERYRRLVDLSPEAITVHRGGVLVFVNPAAAAMLTAQPEALIGRPILDFVHPDSQALVAARLDQLQAGGQVTRVEERLVRCDGQVIDVEVASVAIRYQRQPAIQSVLREMTARKQAEALAAGRAHVLEMIATGAPLTETLTALVALNEAQAPEMVGSILLLDDEGEHLRHGAAPSLPPIYIQAIDGLQIGPCAGSCGTAAYRREAVVVTDVAQDPLWANFRTLALPHGLRACWSTPILGSTGVVLGTFAMYYRVPRAPTAADRDVIAMSTHVAGIAIERARAEAALRASEERFRHLIEGSVQGVLIHRDHTPLFVNHAFAALHGTTVETVMRMTSILPFIAPHERARLIGYREARQRGAAVPSHYEYQGLRQDGTLRWFDTVASAVPWEGGPAILSTVVDITERRHAAAALQRTERLAALGTLAAGIAHEINNPLGMILLAADNARDAGSLEAVTPFLEMILSQGERCDRLVHSILQLAREEPPDTGRCDLHTLIRQAVALTSTEAAGHGVRVELALAETVPLLPLNAVTIEQVFVNLLRNAIDAQAQTVRVTTAVTQAAVCCSVQDDGRGLTAEERQHLFDPFFTTRRHAGGTGLGLSLTHTIIAAHRGTIDVDSPPEGGTTIWVRLLIPPALPEE